MMENTETAPKTFEESLKRLDEIVRQLEDGQTDLETALNRYEEGVGLLKKCHGILESAQRKIEILRGDNSDGSPEIAALTEQEFKTAVAVKTESEA